MKRKCQDNSEARSFNSRWVGWNQTVRVQNYLTERVLISVYSEEPGMVRRRQCLGGGRGEMEKSTQLLNQPSPEVHPTSGFFRHRCQLVPFIFFKPL